MLSGGICLLLPNNFNAHHLFITVGSSLGSEDIEPFNIFPGNATSSTIDLLTPLPNGFTVYSTLICINNAGHHTITYSDGVTILTTPPTSQNAFLFISAPNLTQYDSQAGFIPSSEATFRWGGFEELAGAPLAYEVRLGGVGNNWTNVGHIYSLTLADLPLEIFNVTHVVEVRAVNLAGLTSDSMEKNFTIVNVPPQVTSPGNTQL